LAFSTMSGGCGEEILSFTGRPVVILHNGSLKIQYNRNRCYDYYTGRWLTHGPVRIRALVPSPGNSQQGIAIASRSYVASALLGPDRSLAANWPSLQVGPNWNALLRRSFKSYSIRLDQMENCWPEPWYTAATRLYLYARSDPINYTGPCGLEKEKCNCGPDVTAA